jgi:hypothetical protein
MLGDAENLASWRRGPVLLRRAQSEVVEDPVDGVLIAHEGEDAHALAATDADERIHLVDLGDQPGPAWGAAPPGLRFGRDAGGVRLGAVGGASDAIRVLAVEQRTVLPRVRDVVTHAGEPFERVHGLEVTAQGGVHA